MRLSPLHAKRVYGHTKSDINHRSTPDMKMTLTTLAAALLFTGCADGTEPMGKAEAPPSSTAVETTEPAPAPEPEPVTETVTETTEAAPEPPPEPEVEEAPVLDADTTNRLFTDLIRDTYPAMFLGVSDRDMIDLAHGVCDQFDIGQSFNDVVILGVDAGYTYGQIGGFIGASTAAYCPEHDGVIPR